MLTIATNTRLLQILQICDSNFPVGAFSHSFGMETYLRDDMIKDKDTFKAFIKVYLEGQFIYTDGLAIKLVYKALMDKNIDKIWEIDQEITMQSLARETREGTKRVGQRMIQMLLDLYPDTLLSIYKERIEKELSHGHPAIVFAIIMYDFGASEKEAILCHSFSSVSSLVQNGVRAIPLGQKDGQIILRDMNEYLLEMYEKIQTLDGEDFGMTIPGLEIAQMRHEILHFRLFMS